jgi:hypothetical protein
LGKLSEAKDTMARAIELGQGVDVAVLQKRALEYSESPARKTRIEALFSAIDAAPATPPSGASAGQSA